MKLVDDLYELYRDKLTGDEEDVDILAFSILEDFTHDDLVDLARQMNEEELKGLMAYYIIEKLKVKMIKEGLGRSKMLNVDELQNLH